MLAVAAPASAVGALVTVITLVSTAAAHEPALVTVMVNVTEPPASPAAGVYVGFNAVALAVIEPAPFSVQRMLPPDELAPATVKATFSQTSVSGPALAVGDAVTVNAFVSTALAHVPLLTVIVKVTTLPASAGAGVYTGVNVVAPAVILPAPFSVQRIVPFAELAPDTVNGVVWHVSTVAAPASAVGDAEIVSSLVSCAVPQPATPVTVMVRVTTVPASPTPGVYVGLVAVAFAVILPAPFSVHRIVPFAELAPATVKAVVSQVSELATPASAVGASFTVKTFVSTAFAQLPLPSTVKVSVTVASAAIGV